MIVSYLIPSRVPRVAAIAYLVLGDIVVQLHEIKSVVYPTLTIDAGRISSLEMYAMHEAWPARATIKDISYCAWAAGSQGERVLIPYRDVGALARALHPGAE